MMAVRIPGIRARAWLSSAGEVTCSVVRRGASARQALSQIALAPGRRVSFQRVSAPRALHTTGLFAARAAMSAGNVVKL